MGYSRNYMALLKLKASKVVKGKVCSISHIHPRAYCIANPAPHFAVFAIPTADREPQVKGNAFDTVNNETAKVAKVGHWYAIAYISTPSSGQCYIIDEP